MRRPPLLAEKEECHARWKPRMRIPRSSMSGRIGMSKHMSLLEATRDDSHFAHLVDSLHIVIWSVLRSIMKAANMVTLLKLLSGCICHLVSRWNGGLQ